MIYGLYNSAAGMMVNEYRQNVLAGNLANADTAGFKRDLAVFAERQPAAAARQRQGASREDLATLSGGLWLGRTHTDHAPGRTQRSDLSTDAALDGPGFFAVRAGGQTLYTRDGRMVMTPDGRLVSATDGAAVLGRGGAEIRLDPLGGAPSFDEEGRILQDNRVVGQLELADFADYRALRKVGTSRFDADGAAPQPAAARVKGGFVEGAAVQPVQEMTEMIAAARAYQMNAQMVSLQDATVARLLSLVTRP